MSKRSAAHLLIVLFAVAIVSYAADPIVGTWKMNPAKRSVTGAEMMKSHVITYTEQPGGVIAMVAELVEQKGTVIKRSWTGRRDGKDMAFASEFADTTVHCASKDGYSGSRISKKAGKQVNQGKITISKDGKTMTWNWSGTTPDGKTTSGATVFDRQ